MDAEADRSAVALIGQAFDPDVVLAMPLMANLATLSPGGPRNAPVWFLWEAGALWLLGSAEGRSVMRLQADPRCAVEIVHFDNPRGVLLHLGMRGVAEIVPLDPSLFRRLLRKYLGPDEPGWNPWFVRNIAAIDDPEGRLIRLVPDTVFANNVSYFRTGPVLAWP